MFVSQSVIHSIVALIIVERSFEIWKVDAPLLRFRYRLSVIVLPVFMFPIFQLINPERGSFYFRHDTAIFDSLGWFELKIWDGVTVGIVFFCLALVFTSTLMLLQEIIPLIKDIKKKRRSHMHEAEGIREILKELIKDKQVSPTPSVLIVSEEDPVIFTSGAKNPAIVLSESMIEMLEEKELRSAIAHEVAHIIRRSNLTTLFIFAVRLIMFYNPVSLLVFRRILQDDEQVCDDITVSMTKDPYALASTLRVFYLKNVGELSKIKAIKESIESSSHNLLLEERIERLESAEAGRHYAFMWGRYALTLMTIIGINYYIV